MAVSDYQLGKLTPKEIRIKYNIVSKDALRRWTNQLIETGNIFSKQWKKIGKQYIDEFKIKVIEWMKNTNSTLENTADRFDLAASTIWHWQHLYDSGALLSNQMKKKNNSPREFRTLEEENEYLKAKIAYLEKLPALALLIPNQLKAQIITELRPKHKTEFLLKIANISSSSYYDASTRDYQTNKFDSILVNKIKEITSLHNDYGYRQVTLELHNQEFIVNHKLVRKIMKYCNLTCHAYDKNSGKYNSYQGTVGKIANNLLNRRFTTDRPFQKIVTDITELRWGKQTINERAYFTAFIDLFNNEMISWSITLHPTVDFITGCLEEALSKIPDNLKYRTTIHSDQGFQYQNSRYVKILKSQKIFQSMSKKATCLDNATCESIWQTLKIGTTSTNHYQNYQELQLAISDYVEMYNNKRNQYKLKMPPVLYRLRHQKQVA
jgi:transposase InsO family protein/transposase-like protein